MMGWRVIIALQTVVFVSQAHAGHSNGENGLLLDTGLGPETLGVVVNDDDPVSIRVAEYYKKQSAEYRKST